MNRRKKAILTVGGAILLLSIIFATWLLCPMAVDTDKRCHYIAHACGGIDGQPYTNSREALLASLETVSSLSRATSASPPTVCLC